MPAATIASWTRLDEVQALAALLALVAQLDADDCAWLLRLDADAVRRQFDAARARGGRALPLFGVPFAIKDNIDVAGLPTTAACPDYAYVAQATAPAVQRLLDAGAILVGKTNLDQFATGLVGTRSPYGAVPNAFDARYVSGGSSSGSAVAVARAQVPFALGTDTAGSGRVPAGFNNVVGLKPTRGWLSTRGVVPACRSLDCVSVFALTVEDAERVASIAAGFDDDDAYSRRPPPDARARRLPAQPRLGVPMQPRFCDDDVQARAWDAALARMRALGATPVPMDFAPLHELAALLYDGPWIAERRAMLEDFLAVNADAVHPVVRTIVERGAAYSAVDAFKAEYRRAALVRLAQQRMADVDALLVPTAPTIFTRAQVESDPVALNAQLGTYTNFVNLLDACALALPAGLREDGLPFGVTLIAPAWNDAALSEFGLRWQRHAPWTAGATGVALSADVAVRPQASGPSTVRLAVVGAHLSGMPLNYQLLERSARFVERTTTAAGYRFYALPGTVPPKPGLVRTGAGAPIEVELWDMPVEAFGSFVALVPAPLGIGTLTLDDGREVKGFICENWATAGARDITEFGGWRAFMAAERAQAIA